MKRVFLSYSHRDETYRQELDKHLALLKREGRLDLWSDHRILPGGEIDGEISGAIEAADLILLLVSADFIASDYCFSIEMKRAMERHKKQEAVVVPILVRPCDFQTAPFAKLKMLPSDAKPISTWSSIDDALLDVVRQLRILLREETLQPSNHDQASGSSRPASARSMNLGLAREFSDTEIHDYLRSTFQFIKDYFNNSLEDLKSENPGIDFRIIYSGREDFGAVVFRKGKRIGGCRIRVADSFRSSEIQFGGREDMPANSFNEALTVERGDRSLSMRALMGGSFGAMERKDLTPEGAAEHLWTMFLEPMK
jgi:hypothetical protein